MEQENREKEREKEQDGETRREEEKEKRRPRCHGPWYIQQFGKAVSCHRPLASLSCSYVALVELQVAAENRRPKSSTNADRKVRKKAANPTGTVGSGKNRSGLANSRDPGGTWAAVLSPPASADRPPTPRYALTLGERPSSLLPIQFHFTCPEARRVLCPFACRVAATYRHRQEREISHHKIDQARGGQASHRRTDQRG